MTGVAARLVHDRRDASVVNHPDRPGVDDVREDPTGDVRERTSHSGTATVSSETAAATQEWPIASSTRRFTGRVA